MQKKVFITLGLIISLIFSFSICFAADEHPVQDAMNNAGNAVKDTVNNAENVVEDAVNNTRNAVEGTTEKAENVMNNVGNAVMDTGNNMEKDTRTSTGNDTYTATRTSTDGRATFMGMNATAWTWLILGIAAIAIIAVVWYYSMQVTSENNNSRRD